MRTILFFLLCIFFSFLIFSQTEHLDEDDVDFSKHQNLNYVEKGLKIDENKSFLDEDDIEFNKTIENLSNSSDYSNLSQEEKIKIIEKSKRNIEVQKLANDAMIFLRQNQMSRVEANLQKIQKIDSNSFDFYYIRGIIHFKSYKFKESLHFLKIALQINPYHDPSHFLIGVIFTRLNDWNSATSHFEKATTYNTFNPFYRINLATAYYNIGNYQAAKRESKHAIEFKKNYTKAKVLLAKSLLKLGELEDAYLLSEEMYEQKSSRNQIYPVYLQLKFLYKKDYSGIIRILSSKKSLNATEKRYISQSYYFTGNKNRALNYSEQLIKRGNYFEDDALFYIRILVQTKKISLAEKFVIVETKKFPHLKQKYMDYLVQVKDSQEATDNMHIPFLY